MRPLRFYFQNSRKRTPTHARQKGFTLIEVIVSLVILGILGTFMSTGIARIIEGYFFTRDNADTALKGQVALARMVKEIRSINEVAAGDKTSLTYSYYYNQDGPVTGRILSLKESDGSFLELGGNTLTDRVHEFELTYHNNYDDPGDNTWDGTEKMIGITLKLIGASGQVSSFSTRVVPRNLKG